MSHSPLHSDTDILVAGTGPVGLIAALAMARAGFRVTLAGPPVAIEDRRTTAIMVPGLAFLDTLGVGEKLRAAGAPLRAMRIIDATKQLLRSPPVTFRASEIGEDAFGWNIPNEHLLRVLDEAVDAETAIDRRRHVVAGWVFDRSRAVASFADGNVVSASLAVAADGRASPAREAAGISVHASPLPQMALVLSFGHAREHGNMSNELHGENGPFTQVPLPGNRSSLVWVERPGQAEALMRMPDAALAEAIEQRMQSLLGAVAVEGGRQLYPLSTAAPSRYAANRVVLVGEAAHTIPPIGAQGLNLGIKDVRDLLRVALGNRLDIGSSTAMAAYHSARAFEVASRSAAVNLLNGSLLAAFPGAQALRSLGLATLSGLAPLRALFMREALESGAGLRSLLQTRGAGSVPP